MHIAIIGGGPAGLRAAEVAATGGASVTLYDAKPSVGRKFLVAGRGGLNLTHAEPPSVFADRYTGKRQPPGMWQSLLAEFSAEDLRTWAASLGIETFAASTGRVYPREMKAAPLLRRWRLRLANLGVKFAMRHRWIGLHPGARWRLDFEVTGDPVNETLRVDADAVILALGGGSWPETGSNGNWQAILESIGIDITGLQASNCGWEVDWPEAVLARAEGRPLKNISARAGKKESGHPARIAKRSGTGIQPVTIKSAPAEISHSPNPPFSRSSVSPAGEACQSGTGILPVIVAADVSDSPSPPFPHSSASTTVGELLITRYGLEGGVIYRLGPALRSMPDPAITIDFKPSSSVAQLVAKMGAARENLLAEACKRWRLSDAAAAILEHHPDRSSWNSAEALAAAVKSCPVRLKKPRPIEEAISSAGGVQWSELDSNLMLRKLPGLFAAGEMIDWDAPTGGYLMQGCFSTATRAASGALAWLARDKAAHLDVEQGS